MDDFHPKLDKTDFAIIHFLKTLSAEWVKCDFQLSNDPEERVIQQQALGMLSFAGYLQLRQKMILGADTDSQNNVEVIFTSLGEPTSQDRGKFLRGHALDSWNEAKVVTRVIQQDVEEFRLTVHGCEISREFSGVNSQQFVHLANEICAFVRKKSPLEIGIQRPPVPGVLVCESRKVIKTTSSEPNHSVDKSSSLLKRGQWIFEAMSILRDHPEMTDSQISRKIGKSPSTLSRNKAWRKISEQFRNSSTSERLRGIKKDDGSVECWSEDDD